MHTLLQLGNPSGIKTVLNVLGLCEYEFRLPVFGLNEQQYKIVQTETMKLNETCS
jgi:dihydrodipicolinate synthase/N-acetylneuraminate lyase